MALDDYLDEFEAQGTSIWHEERSERFTSSEMHKLMKDPRGNNKSFYNKLSAEQVKIEYLKREDVEPAKTKPQMIEQLLISDDKKERPVTFSGVGLTYIIQKASEAITGMPEEEILTKAMEWGKEQEPYADKAFQRYTGLVTTETNFIPVDQHSGGSPDRLIGKHAGAEYKCPTKHIQFLKYCSIRSVEELEDKYPNIFWQCMDAMRVTGRSLWYFVAYYGIDPVTNRMPGIKQNLFILEIPRSEDKITLINKRLAVAIDKKLEYIALHDEVMKNQHQRFNPLT